MGRTPNRTCSSHVASMNSMLFDVTIVGVLLAIGSLIFRKFDPRLPLWRRLLKIFFALVITAAISYHFGRTGVIVAFAVAMLPVVYVHGIWLPRHGVNGWTAEPRDKYYALRGWPLPKDLS